MAQQVHTDIFMRGQSKICTWFFGVCEAEGGVDPGDRVKGEGEEDEDNSLATKHAD